MEQETYFAGVESLQDRLIRLKDKNMHTWKEIAAMGEFSDISIGTLHRIYKTGHVPRRYWKRFGIKAVPETDRIAISKTNMLSAAQTICRNIEPDRVFELTDLLLAEIIGERNVR